ncbi:MAG TPA: hypothetical protein VG815_05760 [Chloroflexota bacterium]|jgi:hypothetical protein|nr:hypothetical protein [Chloroflexota bacterium]
MNETTTSDGKNDVAAVTYELDRLYDFLVQYQETPQLREQLIKLVDYAAWEQLATSLRGLRQTVRNLESQVRGQRLPNIDVE